MKTLKYIFAFFAFIFLVTISYYSHEVGVLKTGSPSVDCKNDIEILKFDSNIDFDQLNPILMTAFSEARLSIGLADMIHPCGQHRQKTLIRHFSNSFRTFAIRGTYSDKDRFEMYLNREFFGGVNGSEIYGIEEASQKYFGISQSNLTLNQAIVLYVIQIGPAYYAPKNHVDRLLSKRNEILEVLFEKNRITSEQLNMVLDSKIETIIQ